MLAQVLRPLRGFSSRLLATPIGTKPTADNEQHCGFASAETAFLDLEPASTGQSEQFDIFFNETVADLPAQAPRPLRDICNRLLDTALGKKLTVDRTPHYVGAPCQNALSPEPSAFVSSGSFEVLPCSSADASLPVPCPTQNFNNGSGGQSSQSPWINTMYQAVEARYYQAEAPAQASNGCIADGFLVLQPMCVPVFSPFWGMQMFTATQQPVCSDVTATMFPAGTIQVVPQQFAGPFSESTGSADPATPVDTQEAQLNSTHQTVGQSLRPDDGAISTRVRRHRRSRRGGGSKKSIEEMCLPDVDELQGVEHTNGNDNVALKAADGTEDALPPPLQRATSDDSAGSSNSSVDPLLLELADADEARRQPALDWVLSSFWPLALTKRGCRIVQKAVEVGTPAYQQQLVENLHGSVHEALKSPHSNYVLQKMIETMPPERMQFVISELDGQGPSTARHRFGVRILQRLIEHCHPWQTEKLINEVLQDTASLCRHQFGNFVIQHILQHGSPAQRSTIADVIGADIIRLAKHRIGSHVVSCAMVHCPPEDVQRLTHIVLHDAGQFADLSRREYGSFVVREVNRAARLMRS